MSRSVPRRRALAALLLVAVAALATACDLTKLKDLESALEVIIDVPGLATTVSIQIVDASTGNPVVGNATVSIGGPNASSVIDPIFFNPVGTTTTSTGLLVLGVADAVVPSVASPVRFNVFVSAPGYLETSSALRIDRTGLVTKDIELVHVSRTPTGVVATQKATLVSSDGRTSESVTVTTPTEPNTGSSASLQLPAGTRLTTSSGEALQGSVTATVTYFNSQSQESLRAFPGGLGGVAVSGEARPGSFVTAGFVSIDLRDGTGRSAANLSQSAVVTMAVPPNTRNPVTGQLVRPGDLIPLWSLEPRTGTWKSEGNVIVQSPAAPGLHPMAASVRAAELVAQFITPHLSYFNMDWFSADQCDASAGTRIDLTPAPAGLLTVELFTQGFSHVFNTSAAQNTIGEFPLSLTEISYRVRRFADQGLVATGTLATPLCGSVTTITLPAAPPTSNEVVAMDMRVEVVCPQGERNAVVRPNYPVQYKLEGTNRWSVTQLVSGRSRVTDLLYGRRYDVGVTVKQGEAWIFEKRNFPLTENPGTGDLSENLVFVSGQRVADTVFLAYRVVNFPSICSQI